MPKSSETFSWELPINAIGLARWERCSKISNVVGVGVEFSLILPADERIEEVIKENGIEVCESD
jgi:hypothetical protein